MKEIYVPIKGFEGLYEISNKGNIRTLKFYGKEGNIKILNQSKIGNVYIVSLKDVNNKIKRYSVNKLMRQHFDLKPIEDLENEKWVAIKGFEGLYEISTYARIKNIKEKTKVLVPVCDNGKGYYKVILYKDGKKFTYQVQRLMGIHFLGADETTQVSHKDGDKHNNKLENLYLIPKGYHSFKNKGIKNRRNAKRIKCIELDREFDSIKEASIELGIAYQNILAVLKGRQKTTAKKHFIYL